MISLARKSFDLSSLFASPPRRIAMTRDRVKKSSGSTEASSYRNWFGCVIAIPPQAEKQLMRILLLQSYYNHQSAYAAIQTALLHKPGIAF